MIEPAVRLHVPTAEAMEALGEALAAALAAGDLVLLSGPLGAGKTTLVRGIGAGLNVRGAVTSPTFVIARVHPSLADGPSLVHVDAYRLSSLAELDDLDLDADLDTSVTVVEWGVGVAETLADDRLDVRITRSDTSEVREVELMPSGGGWGDRCDALASLASPEADPDGWNAAPPPAVR